MDEDKKPEVNNYAVVDTNQNPQKVINCVAWDGVSDYDVHAGHGIDDGLILVQSDIAGKDWTYDPETETFSNPNAGGE